MLFLYTVLAALASPAAALAAEPPTRIPGSRVWINPGFLTYHFRAGDFREDNYGFGVEVATSPEHAFVAGSFINSDRERSRYAGYYWRPWRWQHGGIQTGAGAVLALVDGYSTVNAGDWFPGALPAISVEYRRLGANLVFIPHPRNGAALALQLKLRVW